jgi:eukaryotic-like serine/threonine-protein kinase
MALPLPESDEEAELALSVVDADGADSVPSDAGERIEIVAELESVRSLVKAFQSLDTAPRHRHLPPPMPSWGPFILKEEVGRGGFGIVCRGFDPATDREIAVKLYRGSDLPAEPRLLGPVRHDNVVRVYGAAVHDGKPGIWMEFVAGRTLADRVQADGPVSPAEARRIGIALCEALTAVHAAGVVHQDVKPRNVMEEDGGRILLMDFGAGLSSREPSDAREVRRFSGTPLYMAPEVIGGGTPSVASDVYSLGVFLFYLLTGTYPVYATNLQELTRLHDRQRDVSSRRFVNALRDLRPETPDALVECVARALAAEGERYRTPAELQAALETAVESAPASRPVPSAFAWRGAAVAAAAVVAAIGAYRLWSPPAPSAPPSPPPAASAPVSGSAPTAVSVEPSPAATPAVVAPAAAFEIEASMVARRTGGDRRLRTGDRVSVGDRLSLSVAGSRPLHVYVVSQDERGSAHLLFPMHDCRLQNPVPAGRHRLPGVCGGQDTAWEITSVGEREHFLVMASLTRLRQVEERLAALPRPIRADAENTRGVGRQVPLPEESPGSVGFRELEDLARGEVAPRSRAEGVWSQEIVLDNPAP